MAHEGTAFGHYRLLSLLGKGGMGTVYVAFDERRGREVALKVLPDGLAADPEFQDRFRREARTAALLEDPHVVPIHDFGEIGGRLFIDMRLVRGRDLRELIDQDGPLSLPRAVGVIAHVGEALDDAHGQGLIHRDVKPANILVTDRDFAYLTDFGIASREGDTRITRAGMTVGSFTYMAPERFDAAVQIDERADIYALGCVLYESLTGGPPFRGTTLTAQAGAHMTAPRPRTRDQRPELPPAIDAVIAQAMAVDPERRFATCAALSTAAQAALAAAGQPPPAPAARVQNAAADTQTAHTDELPVRESWSAARPAAAAVAGSPTPPEPDERRRAGPLLLIGSLMAGAVLGGGTYWYTTRDHGGASPVAGATSPAKATRGGVAGETSAADRSDAPTPPRSSTSEDKDESASGGSTPDSASAEPQPTRTTVQLPGAASFCPPRSSSGTGELRAYVAYNAAKDPCAWALNVARAVHANRSATAWVILPDQDVVQE